VRHLIRMSTENDLGRDCGLNRRRMDTNRIQVSYKRHESIAISYKDARITGVVSKRSILHLHPKAWTWTISDQAFKIMIVETYC